MSIDPNKDDALETLFSAARDTSPELGEDFVERMMPGASAPHAAGSPAPSSFFLRNWWSALGGLGMATAVGVWIGVVVPVDSLLGVNVFASTESLDLSAFFAGADPIVFFSDEAGL